MDTLTEAYSPSVTSLIITNTNDAQCIAVVEELTFTLIPIDPTKKLNPYNKCYNTGLPFATSITCNLMIEKLQASRFTFVSGIESFIYKV